jgi:hypothetical protein
VINVVVVITLFSQSINQSINQFIFNTGKLIQVKGQREIFLVRDKHRWTFPDFTTFIAMGYKLDDVHIVNHDVFNVIPMGKILPKRKDND